MPPLSRTSFCLTADDVAAVDQARQRLAKEGVFRNQSDVIRAAIRGLEGMNTEQLVTAATGTRQLKPGRRKAPSVGAKGESTGG